MKKTSHAELVRGTNVIADVFENEQKKRRTRHMTQEDLARLIHSSQSRVAKMEKSDSTVSIDLMVRSLLALGTSKTELAKALT